MFKKIIRTIKKYFQVEPIVENPFGRKTTGVKFTIKDEGERLVDRINELLTDCVFPAGVKFSKNSKLKDDLGMDSLDLVETVMYLEEEFMIEISDEDMEKCLTVKDIYNVVELNMEK